MSSAIGSIWGHGDNFVATDHAQYLTDDEISRFLDDLDHDGDGMIDYDEVERKLDAVHDELIPQPREHNILARKKTELLRRLTRLHSHAPTTNTTTTTNTNTNNTTNVNTNSNNRRLSAIPISEERESHDGRGDGGNLTTTTTRATSTTRGGTVSRAQSQRTVEHHHPNNKHRHEFLRSIIGSDARRIPREEFAKRVKEWKIPSLELSNQESNRDYVRKMSLYRWIRAYWAVHGPEISFLMLVISLQVAFGTWQLVKYTRLQYRDAFGGGVGLAKACAGALYPTMFFLIISMSRYISTFLRRSYFLSRFINWDLSQSFHIKIAIVALTLSTLHAIGHLSGTFRIGSEESREDEVALVLGVDDIAIPYDHYIVSVPGLTGLVALGLFYLLALLSMPPVRKWNYEVFQMGHLLMYPIIALLCAHGTSGFLQFPMLGYWLAIPTFFVLVERLFRLSMGFYNINATVRILDGETVEVTVMIPKQRFWNYKPGQYVFFQVPKISRFQWHPFTVSVCVGKKMQLHIKTDGNWTGKLRELADESGQPTEIIVGINGPFGAPAQRFHDYDHAIVVGSGIGVTPFSGILSDLQARDDAIHGGPGSPLLKMNSWNGFGGGGSSSSDSERDRLPPVEENDEHNEKRGKRKRSGTEGHGNIHKEAILRRGSKSNHHNGRKDPDYRRVDFHWTVRERNYLLWMSELLNSVFTSQQWHRQRKLDEQEQRQLEKQQSVSGMHPCPSFSAAAAASIAVGVGVGFGVGLSPFRTRSRQNSYIPPPNVPSTPAGRAAARTPPSPTTQTVSSEDDDPLGPQSPITPITPIAEKKDSLEDLDTLPNLDIRIHTHVTGILSKSRSISTHVYAWLLEMHRTASHPASPLTGLLNPTQFGRPDFVTILDNHYEDMKRLRARDRIKKELEREIKERERKRKAREKERRNRERREKEKEDKAMKKSGSVGGGGGGGSGSGSGGGGGFEHAYKKSNASIGSFRSFTSRTRYNLGRSGSSGHGHGHGHGNGNGNGNGNSGNASVRGSAVSIPDCRNGSRSSVLGRNNSGSGNGGGDRRLSAVSYGGSFVTGNGNSRRHSRYSIFGGGGGSGGRRDRDNRHSNSDMTLSSTGRVDSLYVYSSAAPTVVSRNPSSAGRSGGGGGGGPTEVESPNSSSQSTQPQQPGAGSEVPATEVMMVDEAPTSTSDPTTPMETLETPTTEISSRTMSLSGTSSNTQDVLRVGVFYCGTPAVGSILADRCRALTARGVAEGTGIEYHFMTEVFG